MSGIGTFERCLPRLLVGTYKYNEKIQRFIKSDKDKNNVKLQEK